MKLISKNGHVLGNKGETIVEVVVAFTVLSIMMVLFSQGISYASRSSIQADKNRDSADQAMTELQERKASNTNPPVKMPVTKGDVVLYRQVYTVGSKTYVVYSSSVG